MTTLDLFSGIGGMSLGLEQAGFRTVAFCEVEPFCRAVLEHHWPGVPIHEDVRTLRGSDVGAVDLVAGGFPCQPVSVAGRRKGEADERWLWPEMLRIVREVRPRWVLAENVPGLRTLGADRVLEDLEAEGYACWPLVVGACHVGAPHKRLRVWIVGHRVRTGPERRNENARFDSGLAATLGVEVAQADQRLRDPQGAGRYQVQVCGAVGYQAGMANGLDSSGSDRSEGWRGSRPHQPGQTGQSPLESPDRHAQGELPEPRQPLLPETLLAHGDSAGRGPERSGGLLDGKRQASRDHADGCGVGPVGEPTGRRLAGPGASDAGALPAAPALRWPARPGEPQHEWEEPRLISTRPRLMADAEPNGRGKTGPDSRAMAGDEREEAWSESEAWRVAHDARNEGDAFDENARDAQQPMGGAVDGLPERLVRRANREALRAYGNAVVPQVVAQIGRAILAADARMRYAS